MFFNEIAPSKYTCIGFLANKRKFDRKINTVYYAKLVSFNFGYFYARYKILHI